MITVILLPYLVEEVLFAIQSQDVKAFWFKVVVRNRVDLDAPEDDNLPALGIFLRVDDVLDEVVDMLVEDGRGLRDWVFSAVYSLLTAPHVLLDVLHLVVEAKQVELRLFF